MGINRTPCPDFVALALWKPLRGVSGQHKTRFELESGSPANTLRAMFMSKVQRVRTPGRPARSHTGCVEVGAAAHRSVILILSGLISSGLVGLAGVAEPAGTNRVPVIDGVVQPRQPVAAAVAEAMQFLKRADGGYVPGRTDGGLAGYFTSAFVNEDGTRAARQLAYPARQHAYFIFTFLRYYAYTGEREWLLRARDLANWNLAHSTPADAVYPNLPHSTYLNGQPGGGADQQSLEPDKAAFLGSAYLAVYEATADTKYLKGANAIAETLARRQRDDGSWPFRVVAEDGKIQQDFGGAPVFLVEFFERMLRYEDKPAYHRAHDRALKQMLQRNVEKNAWGTYHEDVRAKEEGYLSAEPMSFTADYLFRHANGHPEYIEMGRQILRRMEERLVHTEGHSAAPAPAVAEQAGFNHLMPGHTARYCLALADLYALTRDEQVKRRALSGINALTYMQSPAGLFRTFFYSVNPKQAKKTRPNWYSQHLYTVCHVLEAMPSLPELVPGKQDHVLGGSVYVREVRYAPGKVTFETIAPSRSVLKLAFTPKAVRAGERELDQLKRLPADDRLGWAFDSAASLLTIRHDGSPIEVTGAAR
jgi:hypothetical protein